MSDGTITRRRDPKTGKLIITRNTTIKQDLMDIGRMAVGFSKKDKSGRGGRQRSQAIDDRVRKATGG